jgi:hypothetical protein
MTDGSWMGVAGGCIYFASRGRQDRHRRDYIHCIKSDAFHYPVHLEDDIRTFNLDEVAPIT